MSLGHDPPGRSSASLRCVPPAVGSLRTRQSRSTSTSFVRVLGRPHNAPAERPSGWCGREGPSTVTSASSLSVRWILASTSNRSTRRGLRRAGCADAAVATCRSCRTRRPSRSSASRCAKHRRRCEDPARRVRVQSRVSDLPAPQRVVGNPALDRERPARRRANRPRPARNEPAGSHEPPAERSEAEDRPGAAEYGASRGADGAERGEAENWLRRRRARSEPRS